MSAIADNLPIEDVFPQDPAPQPEVPESVTPPEETPKEVAPEPQDKAPAVPVNDHIPRWRLNEVLEQNRALKAQLQQHTPAQQPPAAQQGPTPPKQEDYASYEEYIDARAEFKAGLAAEQKWTALQSKQQEDAQKQTMQQRVDSAEETFSQKLYEATAKNPSLMQKLENAPSLRPDLQLILKESKAPIALAEHLADNPALVFQLNKLPMDKAIREMVEAEMKLTPVIGGPSKKPSSQAPNLDPVGGGNTPAPKNPYSQQTSEVDYVAATRRLPSR